MEALRKKMKDDQQKKYQRFFEEQPVSVLDVHFKRTGHLFTENCKSEYWN